MLIFKIYKILSFEYSYSSKFNAIHYFDSKWDHLYESPIAYISSDWRFSFISIVHNLSTKLISDHAVDKKFP